MGWGNTWSARARGVDRLWGGITVAGIALLAWALLGPRGGSVALAGELLLGLAILALAAVGVVSQSRARAAQERATRERRVVAADASSKAELLEVVVESLAEGVTVIDHRGHVLVQNGAARSMLGVPTAEQTSEWQQRYGAFFEDGETSFPEHQMPAVRALAGEISDDVRMVIRNQARPDGLPIEVSARPYQTPDGLRGSVAVFRDISERLEAQRAQSDRETLLSGVVDTSPSAFVIIDGDGRVEWWNRMAERLFGWPSSEAVGRSLADLIVPADLREAHNTGVGRRARGGIPRLGAEPVQLQAIRRDGRPLTIELSLGEVTWEGSRKFHGFIQDVTEREAARQALSNSEERFRTSFENAPVGQLLTQLREPHFGRLIAANPAAQRMLGYSEEELRSRSFRDITHPDDAAQDAEMVPRLLSGDLDRIQYEKRYLRADGSTVWVAMSATVVREPDGSPLHSITQLLDVSERRAQADELARLNRELHHRALYDSLTGLANRGLLMDRLAMALASGRQRVSVGVAFCDVDLFKAINDTHGHQVGDQVLKEVARRLQSSVRESDTVARFGGDEFVLLLDHVASPEEAATIVDRASRAVKEPIVVDGLSVRTSLSGGLVIAAVGSDPDTVLRDADRALYVVKNSGRGRIDPATDGPSTAP